MTVATRFFRKCEVLLLHFAGGVDLRTVKLQSTVRSKLRVWSELSVEQDSRSHSRRGQSSGADKLQSAVELQSTVKPEAGRAGTKFRVRTKFRPRTKLFQARSNFKHGGCKGRQFKEIADDLDIPKEAEGSAIAFPIFLFLHI